MNKIVKYLVCLIGVVVLAGCTEFAQKKDASTTKVNESLRQDVSAAKIATDRAQDKILETKINLESTNYNAAKLSIYGAEAANSVSSVFLTRAQNLAGLPIENQTPVIDNLLSTNVDVRAQEQEKQNTKENEEQKSIAQIKKSNEKLQQYGASYEQEHNSNIVKRFWHWGLATFGLLGFAALLFFCPALIPIFAQIIAKIISWFPSLAHSVGVVATSTIKNTMTAISDTREALKKESEITPGKTYSPSDVLDLLDTNLKISLDQSDKKLIDTLRAKYNI